MDAPEPDQDSTPDREAISRRIREMFESMAPEDRDEALLQWASISFECMRTDQIVRLRSEYIKTFGPRTDVLDLIDGQLALREINALPDESV